MYELIQNNFVAVSITLFLLLFIMTNNNFEKRTTRFFLAAGFTVLILIVEEAWEAHLALSPTFEYLRIPLSAIGYTLRPVIPYILAITIRPHSKSLTLIYAIPLCINAVISFSSLFCGIAFSYTADNQFVRGPLGISPFVIAALYIALLLVYTMQACRNGGAAEALIVSAIAVLAFLATIMESVFGFNFIQNPCIATSVTFYYLYLQSNRSNRDVLTGTLIRRRFYLDAEKYRSQLTALISLDLNDLKTLNDRFGHTAGDKALVTVAATIMRHKSPHISVYRIGGDEFMILCYRLSEDSVKKLISDIRKELAKTQYTCAIGYTLCKPQMDLDALCHTADSFMYKDKKTIKAGRTEAAF